MSGKPNESGVVLVVTLWVIVVLTTVSLAYISQVRMEIKMVGFQRDTAIVDQIAQAGLRQALILLREDRIKDSGEVWDRTIVSFGDDDVWQYDGGNEEWADNPERYIDVPFYERNDKVGYYYVEVEDESAKFPINNMSTTPEMISHLLELSGVDEDDAKGLTAAIIDWRDKDDQPTDLGSRMFGGDPSTEMSFYNSGRAAKKQGLPYFPIKNSELESIDELLLIPGMTADIVYGTLDPEEQDRRRRSRRRYRKGEYLGLKNLITVYSYQINLNTVKAEVMESILYPMLGSEAEDLARDWVDFRDGRDRETYTNDDQTLRTIDNFDDDDIHFTDVDNFTPEVMQTIYPKFAKIDSEDFVVTCLADYEGIEKGFRVVVRRIFIPWDGLPQFGIETRRLEDLDQSRWQIRLFEPLFDAKKRIERMI